MFLDIGGGETVRKKDIVGIFDIDSMNTQETTRAFLRGAEARGLVGGVKDKLPKSFLLCGDGSVRLSPVSAVRLTKRARKKI